MSVSRARPPERPVLPSAVTDHGPHHHDDPRRTVALVTVPRAFEAEAIAQALRERGINARAVGTTMGAVLSNQIAPARVMVLADEAEHARSVLEQIQSEASRIDWSQVEVGEPVEPPPTPRGRWAWTVSLLLVPLGFVVLSVGVQRHDVMIQALGGTALVAAVVIALVMMNADRASSDAE